MPKTTGLNHLGLTVRDLDQTTGFFVDVPGWDVTARDASYPRTTVTDGALRLTLWQVQTDAPMPFDRKAALGLHHFAL
jgi:lactoylglutathione lyase